MIVGDETVETGFSGSLVVSNDADLLLLFRTGRDPVELAMPRFIEAASRSEASRSRSGGSAITPGRLGVQPLTFETLAEA